MLDEIYWYGIGWAKLKGSLVKTAVAHGSDFLNQLAAYEDPDKAARSFLEKYRQEIQKLSRQFKHNNMWSIALGLLFDDDRFVKGVLRDLKALSGEKLKRDGSKLEAEQAFGRFVTYYLLDSIQALDPKAAYQHKKWRRIRKLSKEIEREGFPFGPGERCADEHISQVLDRIQMDFPDDHNLPKTFEGIKKYFYRYCDDCGYPSAQEVGWLMSDTGYAPDATECVDHLYRREPELAEAVMVKCGYVLPNTGSMTAENYREENKLSLGEFRKRIKQALEKLRECVLRAIFVKNRNVLNFEDYAKAIARENGDRHDR